MRSWRSSRPRTRSCVSAVGRDGAESTTRAYAGGIALFLRWCSRTGRDWQAGLGQLGLFMTWLPHAGRRSGIDAVPGGVLRAGARPARSARRVNAVLSAVRGMAVHAVAEGTAPGTLVRLLYEVAEDGDLPDVARARTAGRGGGCGPGTGCMSRDRGGPGERRGCRRAAAGVLLGAGPADRAADGAGGAAPRRGAGLRRSDVHLLADSRELGCGVARAHLHVVRRDNPNRAAAKSRRERAVPLDFLTVQAFDGYEFERMRVPAAASGDFVFVNLFRGPLGAPMRLDAVNDLVAAAARGRESIRHRGRIS